jgi:hypothetical protein
MVLIKDHQRQPSSKVWMCRMLSLAWWRNLGASVGSLAALSDMFHIILVGYGGLLNKVHSIDLKGSDNEY